MRNEILVCLQHQLTQTQIDSLKTNYSIITILKSVNEDLFNRMANSPSDENELDILAEDFLTFVRNRGPHCDTLGPLGSPALMFLIGAKAGFMLKDYQRFLFSHSVRESVEIKQEDGSVLKSSVFNHQKFISL